MPRSTRFGGDVPVVSTMTAPDSPMGTDMGPDFLWMAYSGADQLFRAMTGEPVIPADEAFAPYRLWTARTPVRRARNRAPASVTRSSRATATCGLNHPASEPYTP